jgi:hypothetical protein
MPADDGMGYFRFNFQTAEAVIARSESDDPPSLAMRAMAGLESADAPLRVGGSNRSFFTRRDGLLRGACHRARILRDPLARNDV